MSHCQGSPRLVTLVSVCGIPSLPRETGIPHAWAGRRDRPESIVHEHMSGQEGRVPPVTLDLEDMRLRYDAYQLITPYERKDTDRQSGVWTRVCHP